MDLLLSDWESIFWSPDMLAALLANWVFWPFLALDWLFWESFPYFLQYADVGVLWDITGAVSACISLSSSSFLPQKLLLVSLVLSLRMKYLKFLIYHFFFIKPSLVNTLLLSGASVRFPIPENRSGGIHTFRKANFAWSRSSNGKLFRNIHEIPTFPILRVVHEDRFNCILFFYYFFLYFYVLAEMFSSWEGSICVSSPLLLFSPFSLPFPGLPINNE